MYYDETGATPSGPIPAAQIQPQISNIVVIGSAVTARRPPAYSYYEQERLQTLFLAREINWTGTLASLALNIKATPNIVLSKLYDPHPAFDTDLDAQRMDIQWMDHRLPSPYPDYQHRMVYLHAHQPGLQLQRNKQPACGFLKRQQ